MAIPYLKVEPEQAVKILETWIVKGFELKDQINNEYSQFKPRFGDNSFTNETIEKWIGMVNDWTLKCLDELGKVFVSQRELYNFRDSRPPLGVTAENVRYVGIVKGLEGRIDKLNQYTEFIFHQFNLKFSVTAGRDAIVQTGLSNKAEVSN